MYIKIGMKEYPILMVSSTNNGVESHNSLIKKKVTFRRRLTVIVQHNGKTTFNAAQQNITKNNCNMKSLK